jgi:hypothetical protein
MTGQSSVVPEPFVVVAGGQAPWDCGLDVSFIHKKSAFPVAFVDKLKHVAVSL